LERIFMASPVGHVVVGVGVAGALAGVLGAESTPALWAGAAVASCAPDLDLLPSLWGVPYWRVHRQASHSILVLASLVVLLWAASGRLPLSVGGPQLAAWGAALASHVFLDILCTGPALGKRDHGIPLLWPLSARRWYVRRPIVPDMDLLENPTPAAIARACLWELLHLCPAAGAMILLAQLI
jgi:membrane-bound metal-dependent hydrolase YbcI (DUF457 family)